MVAVGGIPFLPQVPFASSSSFFPFIFLREAVFCFMFMSHVDYFFVQFLLFDPFWSVVLVCSCDVMCGFFRFCSCVGHFVVFFASLSCACFSGLCCFIFSGSVLFLVMLNLLFSMLCWFTIVSWCVAFQCLFVFKPYLTIV